jgi:hypothetical protein
MRGSPAALASHLLLVRPMAIENATTVHGATEVLIANVGDVDQDEEHRGVKFYGKVLIGGMRDQIGQVLLGVLDRGQASNGMSPPWILVDQVDNATATARVDQWLERHPGFLPDEPVDDSPPF